MTTLDLDALRTEVRALAYVRGTPAEAAMWREDDADSRANLAIEGMDLNAEDEALFDMLRDEAVPPPLATAIILKLLDHPDADPALAITPATTAQSLHDDLAALGARMMVEVLAQPEITSTPQPAEGATYARKIDKAEARIDFTRPAAAVRKAYREAMLRFHPDRKRDASLAERVRFVLACSGSKS